MKKVFYLAVAMFILSSAAVYANATVSNAISDNDMAYVSSASDWSFCSSVKLYFFGTHVKGTAPGTYNVEYDSNSGQYRINYKGRWYTNIQSSDKSGYRYMFYADKLYYFNI